MIKQFAKDVDEGLNHSKKTLSSKYFYNKQGDELFIQIMGMPEYYLTRTEMEIFTLQSNNIIDCLELLPSTYFELIELGAGDGTIILDTSLRIDEKFTDIQDYFADIVLTKR